MSLARVVVLSSAVVLLLPACLGRLAGSDALGEGEGEGEGDPLALLDLPSTAFAFADALTAHFQSDFVRGLDNRPADNAITDDGATLGRVLFYATALSAHGRRRASRHR